MGQRISVTCYAGHKGDERPTSFTLRGHTATVREVIDRWYDEDYNGFRVLAEDGEKYLLRHNLNDDGWELVMSRFEDADKETT
jgi:calcineurin-like phosphoesterase family protein